MQTKGKYKRQVIVCFVLVLISAVLVSLPSCQAWGRGEYYSNHYVTVNVLPIEGGTVTCNTQNSPSTNGDSKIFQFTSSETTVIFTAKPAEGRIFEGWYLDNTFEGNLSTITITTTKDWTLTAIFSSTENAEVSGVQQQNELINNMTLGVIILAIAVSILAVVLSITIIRSKNRPAQLP